MAFSEETIATAWERASGQCECDRRNHAHFYTPCSRQLVWGARGTAARGAWEVHHVTTSGGDGVHNCEILCSECYKSSSGRIAPWFPGPDAVFPQHSMYGEGAPRLHKANLVVEPGPQDAPSPTRLTEHREVAGQGESGPTVDRTLRTAAEPFRFYNLALLKKMTGMKATNLAEMLRGLKLAPEGVIYYHTHQFLQEHHYLTPEPPNDFAVWVADSLGDDVLAERLASVDPFTIRDLGEVRNKFVGIIEEHLGQHATSREAMEGKEFYFVESKRFIFPTSQVAHNMKEFAAALRSVGLGTLYFHVFESRLRSARGISDFSTWLINSLGEEALGEAVARLDPYAYSLEGLRSLLIKLVEGRPSQA